MSADKGKVTKTHNPNGTITVQVGGKFAGTIAAKGKTDIPTSDEPLFTDKATGEELTLAEIMERYEVSTNAYLNLQLVEEATPSIEEYVADAEQTYRESLDEVETAERAYAAIQREDNTAGSVVSLKRERELTYAAERTALVAEGEEAIAEACALAKKIYVENGVDERAATWYSTDMRNNAQRANASEEERWTKPFSTLRFKTKSPDPEHPTQKAYLKAKFDPEYQAAVLRVQSANQRLAGAYLRSIFTAEESRLYSERNRTFLTARGQVERAKKHAEAAEENLKEAYARRDCGVPANAMRVALKETSRGWEEMPTISRNPDGTTNVWVWRPGETDGDISSYERVVGIEKAHGSHSANNVLVTESGDKVADVEHYFRGPGTGFNRSYQVAIALPALGATPLDEEANPGAGYKTFIDSTD